MVRLQAASIQAPLYSRLDLAAKAKFGRQTVGGGAHHPRTLLQRLDGKPPHRAGNADGAGHLATEIAHRYGDAAQLRVELAVVNRELGPAYLGDLAAQLVGRRDRLRRQWLQFGARQKLLEL